MTKPLRNLMTLATIGAMAVVLAPAASAQYRDEPYRPDQQYRNDDRQGGEQVGIATFHEALDPYGRWFEHPQYGYVWSPDVDRNWRPYTRGEWKFTEEHGWYWQAEEPWGWAVFHYGRWFLDDDSGWVWVPGTEWAPAWVAWRDGDQAVGWAPLPPEAEWRHGGLHFSPSYYDSPRFNSAWIFAPVAVLTGYAVYRYIFPVSRNYAYVNRTRFVPSHRTVNNQIFNAGFDRGRAQQLTGRQITPLRIVSSAAPPARGAFNSAPRGTLQVYRPSVSRAAVTTAPPKLAAPPHHGWQQGRPGLQAPPFQRPGGWTQPSPQAQPQPAAPQPGFARPGQRPPISPPAQVQQPQQPAPQAQPAAPPRGQNPLIRPTQQITNPAATAPPPAPPRVAPTPPPAAPARAAAPPPAAPPPGAAAPAGAPPQGKGPPQGQGTPQKKRPPQDPNAPPPPKQ